MKELENKKIIITGGCKGIGKAIVQKCLQEGAIVAATYNKSKNKILSLQKDFDEYSGRLYLYQMDVTDGEMVRTVFEQIDEKLNGIDVLVNNAGITKDTLLFSMSYDDWDNVIKTNLYGTFYTCKAVLPYMVPQKNGSIINIASVSGLIGIAGQSNYCASKFGVIGLTKSLSKEIGVKNVRVNAIAPGYVATEMIQDVAAKGVFISNTNSLKRIGEPGEIANIVKFLASDASSYINGQVIVADGGYI